MPYFYVVGPVFIFFGVSYWIASMDDALGWPALGKFFTLVGTVWILAFLASGAIVLLTAILAIIIPLVIGIIIGILAQVT